MGLYRVYMGLYRDYIIGFRTSIMKNRKEKNIGFGVGEKKSDSVLLIQYPNPPEDVILPYIEDPES